jgi:DNA-binding GntR family transcriptional regulator
MEGSMASRDSLDRNLGFRGAPGLAASSDGQDEPLGARAYRVLRHRLITLDLRPGDRFTEAQLAEEMGIGHTPVREALALLARDGLVTSRPRVGYLVTPITVRSVEDLFELRLIVEPAAVRLAAGKIQGVQLEHLEALSQGAYRHDDPESIDRFLDANHELHTIIAEASGNRRLASVVATVLDESRRMTQVRLSLEPRSERFIHRHNELLHALIGGDGEQASRVAASQIAAARDECIAALVSTTRLMELPLTL